MAYIESDLQAVIDRIVESIERQESKLACDKEYLEELLKKREVSDSYLYSNISNNKYFTVDVKEEEYNYILGGDGRSQPYDEKRTGQVATITLNKDYFFRYKSQYDIIEEYVQRIYKPDHIKPFI